MKDKLTIIILLFPASPCARWSISTCPRWHGSFQTLSSWSQSPQHALLIIRTEICLPSLFITKERWRRSSSGHLCSEEWTSSAMVCLCLYQNVCVCVSMSVWFDFLSRNVLFLRVGMAFGWIRCSENGLGGKSKETDPGPVNFIYPLFSTDPQRQRWIWWWLIWCRVAVFFKFQFSRLFCFQVWMVQRFASKSAFQYCF